MSITVIKNNPIKLDYRVAVIADPEGTGIPQVCPLDIFATCTTSIDSEGTLGSLIATVPEAEIKTFEPYTITMKLFANGLQEALFDRNRDAILTKESLAQEVPEWEKKAEESSNARYAEDYKVSISDVRISTVRLYNKEETEVLYEWARPAAAAPEQWTCSFCDSVVTGNFCCNCGAPRS